MERFIYKHKDEMKIAAAVAVILFGYLASEAI